MSSKISKNGQNPKAGHYERPKGRKHYNRTELRIQ
jgi:hypothetical protein